MIPRPTSYFAAVCGSLSFFLGFMVLIGWHTHTPTLIQVFPTFVPMQYNTALGFLFSGLGLALISFPVFSRRIVWGVIVSILGSLTLTEYLFGLNLGIDQVFMKHYITVKTSDPGRMAPNTALCFLFTGLALITHNLETRIARRQNIVGILGALTLGLGLVAFSGYFLNLESAYGWARLTRMAIHTSAGFIILGIGLIGMSWGIDSIQYLKAPKWAASVLSITVLLISLLFWQAFSFQGQTGIGIGILFFGSGAAITSFILITVFRRQKLQERVFEGKQGLLNLILESAGEGIYGLDIEGRTTFANPAAEKMFGFSLEEMSGQLQHDLTHHHYPDGDPYDWPSCPIHATLKDGEFRECEDEVFWRKNGHSFQVSYTCAPILLHGKITGAVVNFSDITKRKKAEEELKEVHAKLKVKVQQRTQQLAEKSAELARLAFEEKQRLTILKLEQAVEQSPTIVIITDLEGKIEYINKAFSKITGYSREEALGLPTSILKSGEMAPEEYKKLWDTIQSGNIWRGEFHNKKKDGSLYWEAASISPIKNDQDEIINFIALKEDITKDKAREEELIRSRNQLIASEKLAGIGELTAGICHEVLNPLNIISISTQMEQRKHPHEKSYSEYLAKVMSEIERIEKILKTLLKFARPTAGVPKISSLEEEMESSLSLVQKDIENSNIAVVRNYEKDLPVLDVDFAELRQIFLNLINNARYAIQEGGTITIGLKKISISDREWVQCSISDTGPGIAESIKNKIFDPFFSTKPEGEGTGLGLSVCHALVERNGGRIIVESTPGQGATFSVQLPLPRKSNASENA